MSEAVNPNHDSASSRSDDPNSSAVPISEPSPATATAASEEDWQTVDFPGAIPIADLIQPASSAAETPGLTSLGSAIASELQKSSLLEPVAEEPENLPNLVQYLRGENTSLRNQIVQLEQDLAQVQIELQLEVARFYCKAVNEVTDGVTDDQSQPTAQQQLVDTLTEQLAASQERIAHLERDCALSQQRYTEQVQLASQLENTCRDLRMRLHRQQQQTLQFKAALEKSLDMSPVLSSDHIISSEPLINSPDAEHSDSAAFIPKAQPVKPWSNPESSVARGHAAAPRSPGKELPNLLKLFHTDAPVHSHPSDVLGSEAANVDLTTPPAELLALAQPAIVPDPVPSTRPETPDLDALFPDIPPMAIAGDAPSQEAIQDTIFDLSPFVEAGEVDPATITAIHPVAPTDAIAQPTASEVPPPTADPAPAPLPENNLWADLARLIEPEMVTENAAIAPDLIIEVDSQAIEHPPSHQPPQATGASEQPVRITERDASRANESAPSPQLVNPFAQPSLEATWVAEMQPGSPFITLKSPTEARDAAIGSFPDPPIPTVSSLEPPAESAPGLPSPVLQPFRPAKKLKSMASVELPSFPRTAE